MSEDEQPGEDEGQEELIAGFAALGGPLTGDEILRLLGSDDAFYGALVRLAMLLLDGDAAAAEDVIRDALTALQDAWSRLGDPEKARVYLRQAVVNRSRSVRRHWAIQSHGIPTAGPGAPAAGHAAAGYVNRDPWACALRVLPDRQREAVVLRTYLDLSEKQAAEAMGISAVTC